MELILISHGFVPTASYFSVHYDVHHIMKSALFPTTGLPLCGVRITRCLPPPPSASASCACGHDVPAANLDYKRCIFQRVSYLRLANAKHGSLELYILEWGNSFKGKRHVFLSPEGQEESKQQLQCADLLTDLCISKSRNLLHKKWQLKLKCSYIILGLH